MIAYLNYGLIGLCAFCMHLFWRILSAEQKRDREPRRRVVHLAILFMLLSLTLAGAGLALELRKIAFEQAKMVEADRVVLEKNLAEAKDVSQKAEQKLVTAQNALGQSQKELTRLLEIKIGEVAKLEGMIASGTNHAPLESLRVSLTNLDKAMSQAIKELKDQPK